jgi:CarD family transcriptional regulator
MFQLKDKVIYPGHGVALIDEIIERTVAQTTITFIKLVFLFKDMTILVPLYNMATIGIRYPTSKDDLAIVLNEFYKKPEKKLESLDFTPSGWNRRNKEYQLKIQGGVLLDLAKIYRDLMYIARQKELSFGERTLLQMVEDLLVQEILVINNSDRETIMQEIRTPFKQMLFQDRSFWQEPAATAT